MIDMKPSQSPKYNMYTIGISFGFNLYSWTLVYSIKHMDYILINDIKFKYPSNKTFNRNLTCLSTLFNTKTKENNNSTIIATTDIGEIFLFSINNNTFYGAFQACSQGGNACLLCDNNTIFVGGGDSKLYKYVYSNHKNSWDMYAKIGLDSPIKSIVLNNNNNDSLIVTTLNCSVYTVDIKSMKCSLVFTGFNNYINNICFSEYNHLFVTSSMINGNIKIWDLSNYLVISEMSCNINCNSLLFYKNKYIISGLNNGSILCYLFDINNKDIYNNTSIKWQISNAHRDSVNSLYIANTKTTDLLFSGGNDGILRVWNFDTKSFISQFPLLIGYHIIYIYLYVYLYLFILC